LFGVDFGLQHALFPENATHTRQLNRTSKRKLRPGRAHFPTRLVLMEYYERLEITPVFDSAPSPVAGDFSVNLDLCSLHLPRGARISNSIFKNRRALRLQRAPSFQFNSGLCPRSSYRTLMLPAVRADRSCDSHAPSGVCSPRAVFKL